MSLTAAPVGDDTIAMCLGYEGSGFFDSSKTNPPTIVLLSVVRTLASRGLRLRVQSDRQLSGSRLSPHRC